MRRFLSRSSRAGSRPERGRLGGLPARCRDPAEPEPGRRLLRRRRPGLVRDRRAPPPRTARRPSASSPLDELSRADRALAQRQKVCPVTRKALGIDGTSRSRGRRLGPRRLPLLRAAAKDAFEVGARRSTWPSCPANHAHDRRDHPLLDPPSAPVVIAASLALAVLGRLGLLAHAGRRDPRPVGEPGHRLHRLEGPRPPRGRGPGHLSPGPRPPGAPRRARGAVVERRRLLDDQRDLRGRASTFEEARRRVAERLAQDPGRAPRRASWPQLAPDSPGDRADLLVHGRGGRPRPGPASRHPGLVRPPSARVGRRRGRGVERGRLSASSTRSPSIRDGSRRSGSRSNEVVDAVAASNSAAGGPRPHQGPAPSTSSAASAGSVRPSRPGDTSFDSQRGRGATWSRSRCRPARPAPSGSPRWPGSRSRPASAAASWRRTATRSPAAWS